MAPSNSEGAIIVAILVGTSVGIIVIICIGVYIRLKRREAAKAPKQNNLQKQVDESSRAKEQNSTSTGGVVGQSPPTVSSSPAMQPPRPSRTRGHSNSNVVSAHLARPSHSSLLAPETGGSVANTAPQTQVEPLPTSPSSDPPINASSEGAATCSGTLQSSSPRLSTQQLAFVQSLMDHGVGGTTLTSIIESMLTQDSGTTPTIPLDHYLPQQAHTDPAGAERIQRVTSPPPSYQPFGV